MNSSALCTPLSRTRIRVGILGPSIVSGGAERWMLNLARYCDPTRLLWSSCVITGADCDEFMLAAISGLMPTYYVNYKYDHNQRIPCTLADAIIQVVDQSDVVIVWELERDILEALEQAAKRIIYVAHRVNDHAYIREHYHLAAVSNNSAASFGMRQPEAMIINNGVDLNRLFPLQNRSMMRARWHIPEADVVIGYIGRIDREKNCVAVARGVEAMVKPARAICYGGRAFQGNAIVDQMSQIAGSKLTVLEPTEDIGSVLHGIDVFILPSHTEACSLSLLEAWGAGVPVVATRVGMLPELEERYGSLAISISPDDSGEKIAAAINEAVEGRSKADIVTRARNLVFTEFNVLTMAQRWTNYIASIVGQ